MLAPVVEMLGCVDARALCVCGTEGKQLTSQCFGAGRNII